MNDSDLNSNYFSEDECESSFGSFSEHSAYSLKRHRNEMNLDNDDTNQQEFEDETDEHQNNRISSDVWEHIDKVTDSENSKCKICSKVFSVKSSTSTLRNHIMI